MNIASGMPSASGGGGAQRRLELAHRVVGKIADHAAGKLRQRAVGDRLVRRPFPAPARRARRPRRCNVRTFEPSRMVISFPRASKTQARPAADDRPAAALFGALGAFQQEGMSAVPQLEVGGQRGLEVRGELGVNGHDIAPLRQLGEGFQRWFDRNGTHKAAKHGGERPGRKPAASACHLTENQLSGNVPP